MKKAWKRTLAMLLVVLMIGGAAPIGVLAEMEWPALPDTEAVSWWYNGMNAIKTAASWLGDKFHGLSLRASAASVVTITSPSTDSSNIAWLDVDDLGQVMWTCSSSLVASYRYTIIEINTSGETVADIARNQWIGRNVMNLYAYENQFNPSRRYKIWVGAYKDSAGDEIIDSGTSIFIYTKGIAPEVTTSSATSITKSSAILKGKLVKNNALPIKSCGFVYSTSPSASALKVNSSTGTTVTISGASGSISNYTMSKAISGLDPDTTYYYCAYATNEAGDGYGDPMSFRTDIDPQTMPAITSVTASPISAGQGTTFTFTVKANEYTEKVGLEIDGNAIAESTSYSVKSGTHTFSISYRIMSIGDDRQVVVYPYKGSQKLTTGTASTTVSVTASDDIGTPQVTSPAGGIVQTSNTALTVTWNATSIAPDSYTVIVYRAGYGSIYRKTDITSRSCTIPAEVFSVAGNYSVEVYAIKEGYASDHPGGVEFTVEAETTDPRIISVEVDPPEGLPNTEYIFTVTANKYTSKVGVEVDGNAIGTTTSYTTVGTTRVFTIKKVISSSGTRTVIAYPYKSSQKLENGIASTTLRILAAPFAGIPTLITPMTGGVYDYSDDLVVQWKAPATAPDSYRVLLYLDGKVVYEASASGTSYTISRSQYRLSSEKSYSVEVYAVKAGYAQDQPATAVFSTSGLFSNLPTVTSAKVDKTSIAVNEVVTFTVATSRTATELYMLTEDGGIAEVWTDSSLYTSTSLKRTWTVTRAIHSDGQRTLRFCAGVDNTINPESYKEVTITVTAEQELEAVAVMTSSDATLTQGDSYTATWTCNVTPSSYTVIVYCNGNQIYTQKNYTSNSFTVRPALLSEPGNYSVEVYPILAGYKSIWGAVELTVQPQVQSDVQILNVSVPDSVRANTDTFVCNVTTNTAASQVQIIYETGGKLDLVYQYTRSGNKVWQLSKQLDTIGLRKMRVVAYDSAGNESAPYPFTVSVLPQEIPWSMQYDTETGDLTISVTAEQVGDSLNAAYAKIVVYEQGYKQDLVPEFNAQTIINNTSTYSKTWNVFTDLGLTSGQTYEIAVGYISTLVNYYGGHDRLVIVRNGYRITPAFVDVPVVYSVEILGTDNEQPAKAPRRSVKSSSEKGDEPKRSKDVVEAYLGESVSFKVITSANATKLYMIAKDHLISKDYNNIRKDLIDLTLSEGTTSRLINIGSGLPLQKEWTVRKVFNGLHCNRQVVFLCSYVDTESGTIRFSNVKKAPERLLIQFPQNSWGGRYDNGTLTVFQTTQGLPIYNGENTYSLWIRNTKTGLLDYYNYDRFTELIRQDASRCLVRSWDVASELHLEEGTTYKFGVRGKSVYADIDGSVSSVDLQLGEFLCDVKCAPYYEIRRVSIQGVPVFRSAYLGDPVIYNDQKCTLDKHEIVYLNTTALNGTDFGNEEWVQIQYDYTMDGIAYHYAYVQRKYLEKVRNVFTQNYKQGKPLYESAKYWYNTPYKHNESCTGCGNINDAGCALLSLTNAVNCLNGNFLNPNDLAFYSINNNHRVHNNGTAGTFFAGASDFFGLQGSFSSTGTLSINYKKLKAHLLDGGTAVARMKGHYIAVVAYDSETQKYLIYDSYPSKNRNTSSGESWLSESYLKTQIHTTNEDGTPNPPGLVDMWLISSYSQKRTSRANSALLLDNNPDIRVQINCLSSQNILSQAIINNNEIDVPQSVETMQVVVLSSQVEDSYIISIDGRSVDEYEWFSVQPDSHLVIQTKRDDQYSHTVLDAVITPSEINNSTEITYASLLYSDCFNDLGDRAGITLELTEQLDVTIPKAIQAIDLSLITLNDYSVVQVYNGDNPIVDPSDIVIDQTKDTLLRIIVTAESGDKKEYSLTIHKEQTLDSNAGLTALLIYPNDGSDESLLVAPDEAIALPNTTHQFSISAFESSAFASSTVYVDGQDCSDGAPVEISDHAEIQVTVTAEDGTVQTYTFPVHYKKYYTVTWNVNGTKTPQSWLEGNALTALLDPTRTGYTFTGWSPSVPDAMPAGDVEFTALFTANTYTLTFNASGGVCTTGTKIVTFDAAYGTLPVPQRSGFVFDGWHAEGNATFLNEQSLVQTASDQTLYADWSMLGDVLRDEVINLQDVVLLTRHLAGGWDTTGIHVPAGDVNRDGEVNLKDAVLIRRYLAGGWNVELI